MGDETIDISNYVWYGHNRSNISRRAIRGSGGVGILIHKCLLSQLSVQVLDDTCEGILWIQLLDNNAHCLLCLCVCYLPPSNSSRGDISVEFFDCLKSQVLEFHSYGRMLICGDFNARIGSLPDVTEESSLLPPRHVIDNTTNSQGKALIEFLQACNLCVLNGRFPDGNQYTSVSSKGLAVVDYCIVPIEEMADHHNFTITSMPEAAESLSLQVDAVLSDHSILSWNTPIVPCVSPQDSSTVTSKVIRKIPDHFMESLACKSIHLIAYRMLF